jgi:hypothetical protein
MNTRWHDFNYYSSKDNDNCVYYGFIKNKKVALSSNLNALSISKKIYKALEKPNNVSSIFKLAVWPDRG